MDSQIKTLIVDNFRGDLNSYAYGDINSGLANIIESYGYDPFSKPGILTWAEAPTQIDPSGSVITDLIFAGQVRVEAGITYVYAIGHLGRLYKIQVNDPTTYNADYDNPVLLATLTINSPTFTRGGFLDFFGATEQIFIGHDKGVTRINFDGTGEAFVGVLGSWVQNVPRPLDQFLGKLYAGNGENIAEIDSTNTVNSYTKLAPGFPSGTQVRDLNRTPDGNYLQSVVTYLPLSDMTATTVETSIIAPNDSYTFIWNGTDVGYTSTTTYPSTVLSAGIMFGSHQYLCGYDFYGGSVYNPIEKILTALPSSTFGDPILPNAVSSISNMFSATSAYPFEGQMVLVYYMFGTIADYEIEPKWCAPLSPYAFGSETDILRSPFQTVVSNFSQGSNTNGYPNGIFGTPKIYYSTLETSTTPTTKYKLYKWRPVSQPDGICEVEAIYQTQAQRFSKKVKASEIRVYGDPWVDGNIIRIDLMNGNDTIIPGTSMTFTAGTNATGIANNGEMIIGTDFAWFTPDMQPSYAMGLRITNLGTVNNTINKVEIDYYEAGK